MPLTLIMRIALRALVRHQLRSALALLGICIGVAAFICSVAVGQGASNQIEEQIRNLGENMIWIEAGGRNVNGVRTGTHGTQSLTVRDARAIAQQIPLVSQISPHVNLRVQVIYHNQNWATMVRGVAPEYLAVRRWVVAGGNAFMHAAVEEAANVCVLGQTVMTNLFGQDDPVGQTIRVQKIPCRVIGVLATKGQSPIGQDQDDVVLMPFTTVQIKIKGITWLDDIMCSAISAEALPTAEAQITALLRERHHIMRNQADDFNLRHPVEVAQARAQAQRTMMLLLAGVAAIALLVGGIGIMNIMLASVTERTREIGIRMAVGAKSRQILAQFLLEAIVLSTIGGTVGIGCGMVGAQLVSDLAGWITLVPLEAVLLAVLFSATVGICFGLYPARRAARLDPIQALRAE